jgi:ketosteroid isomerase-like protein
MATEMKKDQRETTLLERLNQEYVDAFMIADVDWYRQHLAEDFVCIESDGTILNKQEFLVNTAKGPDVADYTLEQVDVKFYGNVALVRATGVWNTSDGVRGISRYVDVYVRADKEWKVVSAQITRTK